MRLKLVADVMSSAGMRPMPNAVPMATTDGVFQGPPKVVQPTATIHPLPHATN